MWCSKPTIEVLYLVFQISQRNKMIFVVVIPLVLAILAFVFAVVSTLIVSYHLIHQAVYDLLY